MGFLARFMSCFRAVFVKNTDFGMCNDISGKLINPRRRETW